MSKLFLDMHKFKKLSSDAKTTTFEHADGHKITVAHTKLSPKMKAEMEAIPLHKAEGGDIEDKSSIEKKKLDFAYSAAQKPDSGYNAKDVQKAAQVSNRAADFAARAEKQKGRKMAEGGFVGHPCRNESCKSYGHVHPNCQCYADGGQISNECKCCSVDPRMMADGGNVAESTQDSPDQIAQDASAQASPGEQPQVAPEQNATPVLPHPNDYAKIYDQIYATQKVNNPGQPDQMARDTALDTATSTKKSDEIKSETAQFNKEQAATQQANHSAAENQRRAAIGLPPLPSDAQLENQESAHQDASGPANEPNQAVNNPQDSFMGNMQKAYQMQNQGIDMGAKAAGDLGTAKAGIQDQQAAAEKDNLENMQTAQHKAISEHENLMNDVKNGYIDPNRYIGSMGTGQKVATGIGMLLSGFGSGLSGQSNLAMDFLNKQIDRDVQAQSTNLAQKNNLLAHNIQLLNSVQDGYRLTSAQMNSMYAHKIDEAASKSMSPQAKAAAMEAKGKLLGQSAMFLGQIGQPGQGNSMDNYLNTMRIVNPERAKEIESRYVPGMGLASVPLSEDARKTLTGKQQLTDASKDMYDWASQHSGSMHPSDIAIGKVKAANLQNMYRGAMNGGVYKKGEQEFIDNIVDSDPTKFFNNVRVLPKLREVMNQNAISTNGLKRSYGFSGPSGNASTAAPSGFQPKSFTPRK